MENLPIRCVFVTDIGDASDTSKWEMYGALEVGFDQKYSPIKIQVVFRTEDGIPFDISTSASYNRGGQNPVNDGTLEVSMTQDSGSLPLSGFTIIITSLECPKGKFRGTISQPGDTIPRPWIGRAVGSTTASLEDIQKGPQPVPEHVKTFLNITPHRFDKEGQRWDMAHEWSADLFQEMLLHSLPEMSRQLFFKNLLPLGDSLHRHLGEHKTRFGNGSSYLDITDIFSADKHMQEVLAIHLLCHQLKAAKWFPEECRACIWDKFNDLFNLLKCPEAEIDHMCSVYGKYLPASQVTGLLREQFSEGTTRTYYLAYWELEAHRWEDVLRAQSGASNALRDVMRVVQSENYKQHTLPRLINSREEEHRLPISKHIALIADKMRLLQHLGGDEVDEAQIREVVLDLLHAASLTGIARQSVIDAPHLDAHLDTKELMNEMMQSNFSRMTNLQKQISGDSAVKFVYPDGESSLTIYECLMLDTGAHGLYQYQWPRPNPSPPCIIL